MVSPSGATAMMSKLAMPVVYYSQLMTVAYGGSAKEAGLDGQVMSMFVIGWAEKWRFFRRPGLAYLRTSEGMKPPL